MTERLRFFDQAAEEVEEAAAWYGKRSGVARIAFLSEIDRAIDSILDAPSRWPIHLENTRRFVCRTFPYTVVYFVEGDTVFVAAVAHEKRRPGYWRDRLP
ncbi:MAG: toxin ParE1/3/4 [Thermoanaerobaculia bacterium]|jgi:plasmid stabilization system protein ParE|nr:toxin ParE1/3/4 [Thermoanaerobaculia bacterium]